MKTEIIKFTAEWCTACKALDKTLVAIGAGYRSIDVDSHRELLGKYNIRSIPVLIRLEDGIEVERIVGNASRTALESFLKVN